MYKHAHNKLFDAFMLYHRSQLYEAVVDYHKPITMIRGLKKGNAAWYAPDQDFRGKDMVFAPFFGIPTYTMVLVSRFARKSGATVIFTYAKRLPEGGGYHLHFFPASKDIAAKDIEIAATALNKGVEQCVKACPEQYQWSYKRFKRRPEGKASVYE